MSDQNNNGVNLDSVKAMAAADAADTLKQAKTSGFKRPGSAQKPQSAAKRLTGNFTPFTTPSPPTAPKPIAWERKAQEDKKKSTQATSSTPLPPTPTAPSTSTSTTPQTPTPFFTNPPNPYISSNAPVEPEKEKPKDYGELPDLEDPGNKTVADPSTDGDEIEDEGDHILVPYGQERQPALAAVAK